MQWLHTGYFLRKGQPLPAQAEVEMIEFLDGYSEAAIPASVRKQLHEGLPDGQPARDSESSAAYETAELDGVDLWTGRFCFWTGVASTALLMVSVFIPLRRVGLGSSFLRVPLLVSLTVFMFDLPLTSKRLAVADWAFQVFVNPTPMFLAALACSGGLVIESFLEAGMSFTMAARIRRKVSAAPA
jgi:hypothetical protein